MHAALSSSITLLEITATRIIFDKVALPEGTYINVVIIKNIFKKEETDKKQKKHVCRSSVSPTRMSSMPITTWLDK